MLKSIRPGHTEVPPNQSLQRTAITVTPFAFAKAAPVLSAAELRRWTAQPLSFALPGPAITLCRAPLTDYANDLYLVP